MSRFPVIPSEELDSSQQLVEAGVQTVFAKVPQLDYKDATGKFYGPYSSIFYTPELIEPWFKLAFAVTGQKRFTPRERELSILAVLAVYDAPYVLYAHSEIAVVAGLSKDQVQQAVQGKAPDNLSEQEAITYMLSLKLARMRGPLDSETFTQAQSVLGKAKLAGLAHLVSGFIHVAMLTNIGDGDVPEKDDCVFLASRDISST